MKLKSIRSYLNKGFTIAELIVVIAIFALIMAVALWNQKELSNTMLITNLGYEVALAVRETQAYGIGVRAQSGADAAQDFQGGFGVYVNINDPERIIVFNDLDDDKVYDGAAEVFATYEFRNQNGNRITALCSEHPANMPCKQNILTSYDEVTVVFKRPNPEASFRADGANGGGTNGVKSGPTYIVLNTPARNNCRAVVIETTGQIHVESITSPSPACSNN